MFDSVFAQVHMPRSLLILCLTNLFCWASLVCYSLYFTDFVGQSVYHGDPIADSGTTSHGRYEDGVRAGAVGMALYSASCSVYSLNIEKLVRTFGKLHRNKTNEKSAWRDANTARLP